MNPYDCPIQQSLNPPAAAQPPRWWAIRSKSTGHLATVGPMGQGAVLAYHDEQDAQADAASMQVSQPKMLWEPIELPSTPPVVCLPDGYRREARVVAVMMKIVERATGSVLHLRITGGPDVTADAIVELSSMIEISLGHTKDTHWVKSTADIALGEIVESKEVA